MSRAPDFAEAQETAQQAAVRMRQRAVGSLVVVNDAYAAVGMITDRDLVERVLAAGKAPTTTLLADVMTTSPVVIAETEGSVRALQVMQQNCVRRLPVEDELGRICGIVTLDDILAAYGEDFQRIAALLRSGTPQGIAEAAASRCE
ncbi:CBS domain-containing protein [Anatilimnocola aggregata]|nr:CBS domain-containing protein [Anatilimnocola aggregata]